MIKYQKGSIGVAIAVVISVVALICSFAFKGGSTPSDNVSGERAGLQEFQDGIKAGDVNAKWVSRTLAPNTNSVLLYANTTGKDVIVDYGEINVITGETASSTGKISLFATTTSSIPTGVDFSTLAGNAGKNILINSVILATSTTATTTSSVYAATAGKGNGSIIVPDGSYLFGLLQQNTVGCLGATGLCEVATSSNRGFNPVFNVRIHKSSLNNVGSAQSF